MHWFIHSFTKMEIPRAINLTPLVFIKQAEKLLPSRDLPNIYMYIARQYMTVDMACFIGLKNWMNWRGKSSGSAVVFDGAKTVHYQNFFLKLLSGVLTA